MVVRQVRSKVVLMTLYFLLKISDRSRGKMSVGMIGSMQLFARQIPKHIRANPATKYTALSGSAFGRQKPEAHWFPALSVFRQYPEK